MHKIKNISIIVLFLIFMPKLFAQVTFKKKLTGLPNGFSAPRPIPTKEGGYIMEGTTYGNNQDIFLVKTDSLLDTLWTRTYGGSLVDQGGIVRQTSDRGCVILGVTASFSSGSNSDLYLIKTDSMGNLSWSKTLGGNYDDAGYSIEQTSDSGYIITYSSYNNFSCGPGKTNLYLVKTNSMGAVQWVNGFCSTANGMIAKQTMDGGYILNSSGYPTFLIKTDASGNVNWAKTYRDSMSAGSIFLLNGSGSVIQTQDGGYMVACYDGSPSGFIAVADYFKTDANGKVLWSKGNSLSGVQCTCSVGFSQISETPDKGYVFEYEYSCSCDNSGTTWSFDDYSVNKTDSMGNVIWEIDSCSSVNQAIDGGYIISGKKGSTDLYKVDMNGNTVCSNSSAGANYGVRHVVSHDTLITLNPGIITALNVATVVGFNQISDSTYCSSIVGVKENKIKESFVYYPNPTTGIFIIETQTKLSQIAITNLIGEEIKEVPIKTQESKSEIDLSTVPNGIYFVKVKTPEGEAVKKIIVQH